LAEVDLPALPPMLYRYRRLDRPNALAQEIESIRKQYIWCASYTKMNDAMEGFYEPTARFQKESTFTRMTADIVSEKSRIGICCFSDTHDNELMWAHYGSNYSGVCVGYRPGPLIRGLPDNLHLARVSYGIEPPVLSANDVATAQTAALKILSHKKASWTYEREWRVLAPLSERNSNGQRYDIASKGCVREVYLGSRISPEHRGMIMSQLSSVHVAIWEMQVSGYVHTWHKIKNIK
jgi:hypothetical protein